MKTLTVRLPEELVASIDSEAQQRSISKSDVVRERLQLTGSKRRTPRSLSAIADLIGAVDGLPADLSSKKKHYLKVTRYGRNRHR
ncbi:MAG: ribbon-helix-helix protein, CopG family [Burkholderiaceae bacterium]